MTDDDLKDIDPEVVEKVLEHADEFISADKQIDAIIEWGEKEILTMEEKVMAGEMKIPEFRRRSDKVHDEVAKKLEDFQKTLAAQYAGAAA